MPGPGQCELLHATNVLLCDCSLQTLWRAPPIFLSLRYHNIWWPVASVLIFYTVRIYIYYMYTDCIHVCKPESTYPTWLDRSRLLAPNLRVTQWYKVPRCWTCVGTTQKGQTASLCAWFINICIYIWYIYDIYMIYIYKYVYIYNIYIYWYIRIITCRCRGSELCGNGTVWNTKVRRRPWFHLHISALMVSRC